MYNRSNKERWDISLEPDEIDGHLQGLGNKIFASEGLIDAVVEGVPYQKRIEMRASVHIRRIGRAALAYAAGVVLLLSSVWVAAHLLSEHEPVSSSFPDDSRPPVVTTTEPNGDTTTDPQDSEPVPQEKPASEGLEFKQYKDGFMWIGLGSCQDTDIVIPSTHKDLPVIAIGLDDLEPKWKIQSITIPASIITIERDALASCYNLTAITVEKGNPIYHSQGNCLIETATGVLVLGCANSIIPDDGSITEIGRTAFNRCTGLKEITIPEGVTVIGAFAFDGCSNLTTVNLPSSLHTIDQFAFEGNLSLTNLALPDNVTRICMYAFSSCESVTELTLPANLRTIENNAFVGCSFTEITIPANVKEIGNSAFWACRELEQVHFTITDGWIVKDSYGNEGVSVEINSPTEAADYLTDTYDNYTWFRN